MALVAPYLTLLRESAEQRDYPLREVFNGLRYLVRYGVAWRAIPPLAFHRLSPTEPWPAPPNDLPPWHAIYDQAQRWLRAGCFEMLAHGLRAVLRLASGRTEEPTAAGAGQPQAAQHARKRGACGVGRAQAHPWV